MKNLTSLSRRGVLPSLDVRGKESGKWQEGRVTWLDTKGSRYPRGSGYGNLEKTGAAMRAWSSEVDDVGETRGRGAPGDVGGGRYIEGGPKYVGGTPAGVGGGGACVRGG
ncbi:hypothetical protein CDL15_Pgr021064 [Punica granatum]|uniref:Uncharacterized protein n=1 Tax=Punica granatum TaxID=22663 RepID=A0A218WS93_PUNGR|nr:hypothetical protein CDL15_Pgr021064 [Punica granatum]